MTPDEIKQHAQPDLIKVPAAVPPASTEPKVPVNQPEAKDGDKPAVPGRTNPDKIEDINFTGDGGSADATKDTNAEDDIPDALNS